MSNSQDDMPEVKELLTYYQKGTFDTLLAKKIYGIMGRMPAEDRTKAIDWLLENREKKQGLDIPAVRQALAETGTRISVYVPAKDFTCDACGMQFKYTACPSYEDKRDKGLFDICPRCGFQVCWTIDYKNLWPAPDIPAPEPDWYYELKVKYKQKVEKQESWAFSKSEDEKFLKQQRYSAQKAIDDAYAARRGLT